MSKIVFFFETCCHYIGVMIEDSSVKPLFQNLFQGAVYIEGNPDNSITFVTIQTPTSASVERMIRIFTGKQANICGPRARGIVYGRDTLLFVERTRFLHHRALASLSSKRNNFFDRAVKLRCRVIWYRIIDGNVCHKAIHSVIIKNDKWKPFLWRATLLNNGFPIDRYRQLSKVQNMRTGPHFYVQIAFADDFRNLWCEYESLLKQVEKLQCQKLLLLLEETQI